MNTVQDRERCLCVLKLDNPWKDFIRECRNLHIADPDGLMDEILRYIFLAEISGIYEYTYDINTSFWTRASEIEQMISRFIEDNEVDILEDLDDFHRYIADYNAENLWFVCDFTPCMRYLTIQLRYYDETVCDV